MGKIEVSNFLRMIAFGLVIISFYSIYTQYEVQKRVLK